MNHLAVHMKPTQYCKSIILHYKIKIKLEKKKWKERRKKESKKEWRKDGKKETERGRISELPWFLSEFAFVIISPSMCSLPILPTYFLSLKSCMELAPIAYHQRSLTDSHVSSLFLLCDILARKSAVTGYMGIESYDGPNCLFVKSCVIIKLSRWNDYSSLNTPILHMYYLWFYLVNWAYRSL